MKERPIIFSTDMVRAILQDHKTQTRRTRGLKKINENPHKYRHAGMTAFTDKGRSLFSFSIKSEYWNTLLPCPYGQPGDHLWVRETFCDLFSPPAYKVDRKCLDHEVLLTTGKWKSPRYMPRKYAKIISEITDIDVERIRDIRVEDCIAEGVTANKHKLAFKHLWNSINEKRGYGWDKNPWVWVISFRRIT